MATPTSARLISIDQPRPQKAATPAERAKNYRLRKKAAKPPAPDEALIPPNYLPEPANRAAEGAAIVGLDASAAKRFPHEFSGGQRQRIGIARALALHPDVLVADEPVSALDVSVQAQVLALLADIKARLHLSMLFVTHDLRVALQVCDRIAVMKQGEVVEVAPTAEIFFNPQHSYTKALFAAERLSQSNRSPRIVGHAPLLNFRTPQRQAMACPSLAERPLSMRADRRSPRHFVNAGQELTGGELLVAPWTRDGQVRVQVADIAPQVPGQIVKLLGHFV
jgi:ABC-type dipeptide/oligopeptide/nickel transport system ATPase component